MLRGDCIRIIWRQREESKGGGSIIRAGGVVKILGGVDVLP